jgi:hypothetical protein
MMRDPAGLVADFQEAAAMAGTPGWPCPLRFEILPAPHKRHALPVGEGAVYVFAVSAAYGTRAPCGGGTVLKVGQVGPGNEPRFTYMHYRPNVPSISTLAQSLLAHPILWSWLGIDHIDANKVEDWMLTNLDRIHFFMPGDRQELRDALEVYVRGRVGSIFEGASHGRARSRGNAG